ncbi:hypothetical protein BGX26_012144 [Mortierella sp. AD094]|nr:hypothetical protein BGX26_012144 [Mortierella sp. AD094]
MKSLYHQLALIFGLASLAILVLTVYSLNKNVVNGLLHKLTLTNTFHPSLNPLLSNPVPQKSQWDPSRRYLVYLPFEGISNQLYSLQNAATMAKRLNRTLVVPPITSNRHDRLGTNQPWSRYMDQEHMSVHSGIQLVEWHNIKHIDEASRQIIDAGEQDSIGADFAYQFMLDLEPVPVPGFTLEEPVTYVGDILDRNQNSTEPVICFTFTFTAQFERGRNRWDVGWDKAGQYIRFLPRFASYVEDVIAFRFGLLERHIHPHPPLDLGTSILDKGSNSETFLSRKPPHKDYIAIHLRRGDIETKYTESLDVVLVSDTQSEEEKQEIDSYGWYRLDHAVDINLLDASKVLGPFSPALIDSAVLTGRGARWVIGSRRSTMSWLAAMRMYSWYNVTIIYPAPSVQQMAEDLASETELVRKKKKPRRMTSSRHPLSEFEENRIKRFSGLFGASMTEIPSPSPEQQAAQSTISGSNSSSQGFSPQMLSSQGRQGSMMTLGNSGGIGNFPSQSNNNSNVANKDNSQGEEENGLNSLTRAEVHQSLDNLKKLVIAAESYRELSSKLAKTTKQLGKCFKEYSDSKGMDNTYVMCLKSSANFYESFSEMQSKLATCLQKDFELLQNNWEKHTKRVTKDERAHDEILGDLDERIKKISSSYDKKSKKPDPNTALMSHEIACRLSEAQFLAIERQLRGSGPSLLKIKEWAPYAGYDMPPPTLVTNGDPTIEIRGGSFEEYIARHAGNQQSAIEVPKSDHSTVAPGGSSMPVYTISDMPQITLPPFAPMQQHLQQQQQQQQQPPSVSMPMPMLVPQTSTPSTNFPTSMPDPKLYIPQRQPVTTTPQTIALPATRIETTSVQGPAVKAVSTDQKVLVKETPAIVNAPEKVIQSGKPIPVSTVSTVIASDSIRVLTASPPSTPGAFPDTTTNLEKESKVASKLTMDLKRRDGIENADGSFPEDQGSVSTKVGSAYEGSTRGDRTSAKVGYLQDLEHSQRLAAEEATDAAALGLYHNEEFVERYRYTEEEAAHYRSEQRRDGEQDDDLYDDPYSPTSGDRLSFYDEGEDISRMEQRRYYDDDESQHSGSIPIQRDREYFASRSRYEDRDYDRSYQHYSSSVPARHQQHQYLSERELDQAEWTAAALAAAETASIGGYAREQYPSPREYPRRPTLEDRERELELINQKTAGARGTNGHRPATAPGTVAHLRRRFSDQSVSDTSSIPGGMVTPSQGPRPRGMSGSALNLQQQQQQQQQQDALRRDPRYPPRASTPQSRLVAASAHRYERNISKGTMSGSSSQLMGTGSGVGGRYSSAGGAGGLMSDYEDAGRISVLAGDQQARRR